MFRILACSCFSSCAFLPLNSRGLICRRLHLIVVFVTVFMNDGMNVWNHVIVILSFDPCVWFYINMYVFLFLFAYMGSMSKKVGRSWQLEHVGDDWEIVLHPLADTCNKKLFVQSWFFFITEKLFNDFTCSVLTSPPVLLGAGGRMSWFLWLSTWRQILTI